MRSRIWTYGCTSTCLHTPVFSPIRGQSLKRLGLGRLTSPSFSHFCGDTKPHHWATLPLIILWAAVSMKLTAIVIWCEVNPLSSHMARCYLASGALIKFWTLSKHISLSFQAVTVSHWAYIGVCTVTLSPIERMPRPEAWYQAHCFLDSSCPVGTMVRVEGFEPPNSRAKICCLTAWRYPNI